MFVFFRDRGNTAALHRIVTDFYTPHEISAAKKCLIDAFQAAVIDCPYVIERRNSSVRQAHDAEAEDITGLFVVIDGKKLLNSIAFAAVNHDRVPRYGPEEINICAVMNRQSQADTKIEQLSQQVEHIPQSGAENATAISANIKLMEELNAKLLTLKDHIDTQLLHLDRPQLASATSVASPISAHRKDEQIMSNDGSRNVVVTGITEDKNFR